SPGHVPLLNAAEPLLEGRRGHTELTTALMIMAGLAPTATICEMMADDGRALSKEDAKAYARARNLVFLEGQDIVRAWRLWSVEWRRGSSISSIPVTSISSARRRSSGTSCGSWSPGSQQPDGYAPNGSCP